jgi:hypothetical protein
MSTAEQQSERLDADADVRRKKGRSWLKIGVFYVLTPLLTLPLELLNHHAQGNGARVITTGVMRRRSDPRTPRFSSCVSAQKVS